jgi:phosphoribosylformylglycinamidine (FGAM) synthase-like enzyme
VDLALERKAGELIRALIEDGTATAVHDVSDGGIAVTLAEMALAGGIGVSFWEEDWAEPSTNFLFGEEQGRYVFTAKTPSREAVRAIRVRIEAAGVEFRYLATLAAIVGTLVRKMNGNRLMEASGNGPGGQFPSPISAPRMRASSPR